MDPRVLEMHTTLMKNALKHAPFALCLALLAMSWERAFAAPEVRPALVAWITVDQLPAGVLTTNLDRLKGDGLGELAAAGVYYRRATYDHAVTFTATGHATLFTGRHPCEHGVIANEWADRTTGAEVACVEDPTEHLLGEPTKAHQGTSPRLLLVPTLGDRLIQSSGGSSRVFSVSFKDRGAILPGGRNGKAFWFSTATGRFVTSSYYFTNTPAWCETWNQARRIESFRAGSWDLLMDRTNYVRAAKDDRPYERDLFGLGRTFPHPLPGGSRTDLFSAITCTPIGDELPSTSHWNWRGRNGSGRARILICWPSVSRART